MLRPLVLLMICVGLSTGRFELAASENESDAELARISKIVEERTRVISAELSGISGNHAWAGKYSSGGHPAMNISLLLAPKSGFVFEWEGCLGTYDQNYGPVRADGAELQLFCELPNHRDEGFHGIDTNFTAVRWGGRRYLITASEMIEFVNAVNSKDEPRKDRGHFLMRDGDEKREISGDPDLPAQYKAYLRRSPVAAEIISVEPPTRTDCNNCYESRATLNAGEKDGVFTGMQLSTLSKTDFHPGKVVKVATKTSEIVFEHDADSDGIPKVGWKLSTRPPWRDHE